MIFLFQIALKVLDPERGQPFCAVTVFVCEDISALEKPVNQVFVHKSQGTQLLILARCDQSYILRIKIHHLYLPCIFSLGYDPGCMGIGIGNHKIISVDPLCQHLITAFVNIDLVKILCHYQEQLVILVYIRKNSQIILEKFIGLRTWYKHLFLYHVLVAVIMINTNAAVSFMISAAHISINHKIHVAVFFYAKKLDVMVHICISGIAVNISAKAEYVHKFTAFRRIGPQLAFPDKGHYRSVFVCHVGDILISNSKKQAFIADHRKLRIKDLMGRSCKIKKHNTCFRITHSVKICHIIIFCFSFIIGSHDLILQRNTGSGLINILDHRNPCSGYLRM